MKYKHKLTGIVIDVNSEIKGEFWEPMKAAADDTEPEKAPKKRTKKNG